MRRTNAEPLSGLVAIGFVLLGASLIAALWLQEWRLVPTGIILIALCAIVSGYRRKDR